MTEQSNHTPPPEREEDLNQILRARRDKLERLQELGVNPYPYRFEVQHRIADILSDFDNLLEKEDDASSAQQLSIAGRIVTIRVMGKAAFCHLRDSSGQKKLQLYIKKDIVGEKGYEIFKLLDIGDIIGVVGTAFRTKTGEETLRVLSFELLCKNIYPLPIVKEREGQVFDEFTDKETRYRQRYVDVAVNWKTYDVFERRARLISTLRRFLDDKGFLEVETPILQPLYGGALAKPFMTDYHALDRTFFLRIADELYLKRLLVGGIEKVYEIGKDFRNEGMDRFHNPEFTMLEFYQAYADYNDTMSLTEKMLRECALKVTGNYNVIFKPMKTIATFRLSSVSNGFEEIEIDFEKVFERITFFELLRDFTDEELPDKSLEELREIARKKNVENPENMGEGKILDELMKSGMNTYLEKHNSPRLAQPTIVYDYPLSLSPLAKKHRKDERLVERFQIFAGGLELCNAFSELNDPFDQRERFEAQRQLREAGDEETQPIDKDFLHALEIGMPPASGVGIGIDRLTMLLTNQPSIRDVILFPALRTEQH
ncbi:lysine--tRNA ligase [bacterium]|nr:lysine--tRNA ligase [bacterium]